MATTSQSDVTKPNEVSSSEGQGSAPLPDANLVGGDLAKEVGDGENLQNAEKPKDPIEERREQIDNKIGQILPLLNGLCMEDIQDILKKVEGYCFLFPITIPIHP